MRAYARLMRDAARTLRKHMLCEQGARTQVTRDLATGELTTMRFYACLGKLLPFSKPLFSYLLYTRKVDVPGREVQLMVQQDQRLANGALDLGGVVYTNRSMWRMCGYL